MTSFPTIPCTDINVTRSEVFSTLIQCGASGKELRAAFSATPRYRYTLTINALRQSTFNPAPTQDEVALVKAFFESVYGSWGTFNFTDPVDGTVCTCRFDQDNWDLEQICQGAWDGKTIKLISVK